MSENQTQVNQLLAESLSGKTSRRDIMKRAAALGLSAPLVGILMSAHGAAAQDATPSSGANPPGYTAVAPAGLRTDLTGTEITVILGDDGTSKPWEEAVIQLFTDTTGIKVNRVSGPTSATERLAQYLTLFSAGSSDVDVVQIDVIWPGIVAPHSIDLSPVVAASGTEYFAALMANNTVNEALVGIPWFTDAPLLYSRQDLLEKYGYAAPPTTWADLTTYAQTIQDGERAAGNDSFWGFVFQGAAYEGLTCDGLEWQYSNNGGTIVEPDGTVSINNPNAAAAFDMARGWVGTIAPEGVTGYDEEASRGVWQGGNAAFMRNWPYAFTLAQAVDSLIKDKVTVGELPMGSAEGSRSAATLGGWQIMVTKYSKNQDAAMEFARYITSPELQASAAIEIGHTPTIASVYDIPAVLAANPFYTALLPVFTGGAVARPSTVSGKYYNDISTVFFTAVNQVLTGQLTGQQAVEQMQPAIQDIMDEKAAD